MISFEGKNSAAIAREGAIGIVREGGISPLIELMRDGTDDQKQWATYALGNIAKDNEANRAAIAQRDTIASLMILLRAGTNAQKQWASYTLGYLAKHNKKNAAEIANEGAIEQLIGLVESGTYEQMEIAARALEMIASDNEVTQAQIGREGGIALLVSLLRDGDLKEVAVSTLSTLANNNMDICERIPGKALSVSSSSHSRDLASDNEGNRAQIDRDGGVEPLVALLKTGTDEQKGYAALALGNLGSDNQANRAEIGPAGGVKPLIALVKTGSEQQKCYAALALGNLASKNDANRAAKRLCWSSCSPAPPTSNRMGPESRQKVVQRQSAQVQGAFCSSTHDAILATCPPVSTWYPTP
ncbi:unnamed protein product [Phytophthora lilii]|uniref:Unnamed protein product n=1 Tax=Phytophthora lilii TaxID=2077276 RepID=A0A9W6UDP8_9STRA|nr:unnamed protein product [Phytophthora lilii]